MRTIYCPVCATECEYTAFEFRCYAGGGLSAKLGNQVINAVGRAIKPTWPPRVPAIAEYLSCPNCTAPFGDHTSNDRALRCARCTFELPVLAQLELNEERAAHPALDTDED